MMTNFCVGWIQEDDGAEGEGDEGLHYSTCCPNAAPHSTPQSHPNSQHVALTPPLTRHPNLIQIAKYGKSQIPVVTLVHNTLNFPLPRHPRFQSLSMEIHPSAILWLGPTTTSSNMTKIMCRNHGKRHGIGCSFLERLERQSCFWPQRIETTTLFQVTALASWGTKIGQRAAAMEDVERTDTRPISKLGIEDFGDSKDGIYNHEMEQYLYEIYNHNLELRVSKVGVNLLLKWMKELERMFYGNIIAYGATLGKQPDLQSAIWRLANYVIQMQRKCFQTLRKVGVKVVVVSTFDTRLRPLTRALKDVFEHIGFMSSTTIWKLRKK